MDPFFTHDSGGGGGIMVSLWCPRVRLSVFSFLDDSLCKCVSGFSLNCVCVH